MIDVLTKKNINMVKNDVCTSFSLDGERERGLSEANYLFFFLEIMQANVTFKIEDNSG